MTTPEGLLLCCAGVVVGLLAWVLAGASRRRFVRATPWRRDLPLALGASSLAVSLIAFATSSWASTASIVGTAIFVNVGLRFAIALVRRRDPQARTGAP